MLDIPEGLTVRRTRKIDGVVYIVSTVCKDKLSRCPRCGHSEFWKSGHSVRKVVDIPHKGTPVELNIDIPRIQCKECMSQLYPPLPDEIDGVSRTTKRLKKYIVDFVNSGRTFTEVSRLCGISFDTVSVIYRSSTGRKPTNWRSLPRTPSIRSA
jgi:transposase